MRVLHAMRTVVSAQFEQHLAETGLDDLADLAADGLAASERDCRYSPVSTLVDMSLSTHTHVDITAFHDALADVLASSHKACDGAWDTILLQNA